MIVVDYRTLSDTQLSLRGVHGDIGRQLESIGQAVDFLRENWEGAASEGFQRTADEWRSAAADVHDTLASIHNMVATSHDNHAGAVRAGVKRWRGGIR